jgi:predicted Zn-dependent protease
MSTPYILNLFNIHQKYCLHAINQIYERFRKLTHIMINQFRRGYFLLIFSAVLVSACATIPTGRRQLMIVSEESTIPASKQAYVEMLRPYAQQGKIDNDPDLKNRVDAITGRLIAQAIKMRPETRNWKWTIKIIDDPETVNAWAMNGGEDGTLLRSCRKNQADRFSTHPSPVNREKKLAEYVPEMMPYYKQKEKRPVHKL